MEKMGKKYVITLLGNQGGRAEVKKVVSPHELFYQNSKDEIVECSEKFVDDYLKNPHARTTIRYRDTGNDDDKEADEDFFTRVRIVNWKHDGESTMTENQENDTLGRGKRLMRKKMNMDTPDILVVKRNWKTEIPVLVRSQQNNDVKEIAKQLLKTKRDLHKAKEIAGENALDKLEMNSAEILPIYDDNDREEALQLPITDLHSGTGSEEITEARNGESRPGNSDDENAKKQQVEQMERAEHDDSAVAGSERISTGNKVLSPTELKTDSTEDGRPEDPNKNATDSDGETEIAAGSSHCSHTDDNDSLGYIEDSCDEKRVVALEMESELPEKIFISTDVLALDDEKNEEKGDSDDAPGNTYIDIGTVTADDADHPNRDTPLVERSELTGGNASPRKEHDLDEERRSEKFRNSVTIKTRSEKIDRKSKRGVSTSVHNIRGSGRTSKNIPKANKRIVVKKVEAFPGTSTKSTATRIERIAQRRNGGKIAVSQETPVRQVTPHAGRNLKSFFPKSRIIEGARKVRTFGKEGNRSYDRCVGNQSVGTILNTDTEKEKVVEQWKKKKIVATAKNNVKQPKEVCDVSPRNASPSKLPVISKTMKKATTKVMPPFSKPGPSSVQDMGEGTATRRGHKTKREDPFEFEDSEKDVLKVAKKLKTNFLPAPAGKLKERSLSHQNKTKSVQGKEQARCEKRQGKHGRTVVGNSSDGETPGDEQEIATGRASFQRRMETIREMASEFNILVKQMNRFAKRFKNFCEEGSSDESHFEIAGLEDENVDEIEVAPNFHLPRETAARAGLSNSMSNRLGILMRSLWNDKTRQLLTTKKDGKGDAGRKRVSEAQALLLRDACYNLQSYKKLPLDEVKTIEDTMQSIGKKLSYNRYNLLRQQKRIIQKQTERREAVSEESENTCDNCDASISDDNDHDEGEEVGGDDDSETY